LTAMPGNELPQSTAGGQLHQQLVGEIRHQKDLLLANTDFLADVRDNDPLSKKWAAYSDLCWAKAVGHLIDQAANHVDGQAANVLRQRKDAYITQQTTAFEQAPQYERTTIPGTVGKDDHPVALGQKDAKAFLLASLQQAGVPDDEIARLTSKASYA